MPVLFGTNTDEVLNGQIVKFQHTLHLYEALTGQDLGSGEFDSIVSGDWDVKGLAQFEEITVTTDQLIQNDLTVNGNFDVDNDGNIVGNLSVDGNFTVDNNLTLSGYSVTDIDNTIDAGSPSDSQLVTEEAVVNWVEGNFITAITTSGTGVSGSGGSGTVNIEHVDTSALGPNTFTTSGSNVIEEIVLDEYGHIDTITTRTLNLNFDNYQNWVLEDDSGNINTITSTENLVIKGDGSDIETSFDGNDLEISLTGSLNTDRLLFSSNTRVQAFSFGAEVFGDLRVSDNTGNGSIDADGNITATGNAGGANGDITAAGNLEAGGNIDASGNIEGDALIVADEVTAGTNIEAGGNIEATGTAGTADGDIIAAGNIEADGDIKAQGDVIAFWNPSDQKLKDDLRLIQNPMDVLNVGGYRFTFNDNSKSYYQGKKSIGVVAQEIQKYFPELVQERSDGYLGVNYPKLTAVLIEAFKQQNDRISRLEKEITDLKS